MFKGRAVLRLVDGALEDLNARDGVAVNHKVSDADAANALRLFGTWLCERIGPAIAESLPRLVSDVRGQLADERHPPKSAPTNVAALGPKYLDKDDVVAVTQYSKRTIERAIESGELRPCGRRRDRFTRFEVDRWMELNAEPKPDGAQPPSPAVDLDAEAERLLAKIDDSDE